MATAVQEHGAMSLLVQGYYAILDVKGASFDLAATLAHAGRLLAAHPCCLQLRAKSLPTASYCRLARELRRACSEAGTPLCINDRLDVALAVEADAIHLGQSDLPLEDALRLRSRVRALAIGISTHDPAQARAAVRGGADHIGFGPIFATGSKADADAPVGLDALAELAREVSIPIVAIGGITLENVDRIAAAGAAAAAAIAAVDNAPDPTEAGRRMGRAFAAARLSRPERT